MPRSVDFFFLVNYKEKEKYFSYPRKCFLGLTFAIFKAVRKLRVSKGQGKNVGENKNQNVVIRLAMDGAGNSAIGER